MEINNTNSIPYSNKKKDEEYESDNLIMIIYHLIQKKL